MRSRPPRRRRPWPSAQSFVPAVASSRRSGRQPGLWPGDGCRRPAHAPVAAAARLPGDRHGDRAGHRGATLETLQAYLHVYVHTALRRHVAHAVPAHRAAGRPSSPLLGPGRVRRRELRGHHELVALDPRRGGVHGRARGPRSATGQAVAGWSSNTPAAIDVDANTGLLAGSTPAPTTATITLQDEHARRVADRHRRRRPRLVCRRGRRGGRRSRASRRWRTSPTC